jgi:hypothetical protein
MTIVAEALTDPCCTNSCTSSTRSVTSTGRYSIPRSSDCIVNGTELDRVRA